MSGLCQCLQRFWTLHAEDEAAALIQRLANGGEREEVSYLQVRTWQREVKTALRLGEDEWGVVGVNMAPFSVEETALMLLLAEERKWTYVPVDIQLPVARQLEMVRSAGIQRLVTTSSSPLAKLFASSDSHEARAVKLREVGLKTSPLKPVQVPVFPDEYFQSERAESMLRRKVTAKKNGEAPLYVLFTSGTTGKPRGVLGTRAGAWTRLEWMWTAYPFSDNNSERVLRATKLSFVDSVWEILGAFLQRVPLVHIQQSRRHQNGISTDQDTAKSVVLDDCSRFLEVMHAEHVTRFTAVPSVLEMLLLQTNETGRLSKLTGLRYILSSGEILSLRVVQELTCALPDVTILNLYGSTEVSGDVTCMELNAPLTSTQVTEWQERGVPIANLSSGRIVGGEETSLLMVSSDSLDRTSQPSGSTSAIVWPPSGETIHEALQGMLYVSGPLVSLGYINCHDDEDAFVPVTSDMLVDSHNDGLLASKRWFRTGDVCSVIQGRLYFCGRKDNAVKIHGQRVYLEAVERAVAAALRETSDAKGLRDLSNMQVIAFATTKEVGTHAALLQAIVACIIRDDVINVPAVQYPCMRAMKSWIAHHYGASHTPHQVLVVSSDAVQRLPHGKIDRRALETLLGHDAVAIKPSVKTLTTDDNASNAPERTLARILKETLDVELQTGIPDEVRARTFGEIGANSLLATLIVYELNKAFGSHQVKSHALVGMTVGEVLWTLSKWKENTEGKALPESTRNEICSPETGSGIKRQKLRSSASGDTARSTDDKRHPGALTYVSRYNQSSLTVDGVYIPTCSTSPQPSPHVASTPPMSTPWMLTRRWRVDLGKCIDASPLVIQRHDVNGAASSTWAIVGSHSAQLVCVDVQDSGREIWRVTLDDRIEASAALSVKHGIIYVGTYAGSLFGLELQSGDTLWSFRAKETIKSSALVIDSRRLVLFGAYDSNLYGLDAVTGQKRWAMDLRGSIFSTPLYCGWSKQLFAATTRGIVAAFQFTSSTGDDIKEQWKLQLPAPVFAGLNADPESKILVAGCADGGLYGVSMDSGNIQWRLPTEKPIFSSPCVYRAGSVVVGSHDDMLRKVNPHSGKLVWSTNLHGAVFASPTVFRINGTMVCCVTTTTGHVYFCDESTGSIIYHTCDSSGNAATKPDSSELGPLFGSPVLIDNWCLLGTRTNFFYGFELKDLCPHGK